MAEHNKSEIDGILKPWLDKNIEILRSSIEESGELPSNLFDQLLTFLYFWIKYDFLHEPEQNFQDQLNLGTCSIGNKPLDEKDFDHLIKIWGYPVHGRKMSTGVLVLGRDLESQPEKINLDDLIENITRGAGGELRIYSQEMFLFSMLSGWDIYEEDDCDLDVKVHILSHPLLQKIRNHYFEWPDTFAIPGSKHEINIDSSKHGVLSIFGYKVGLDGLNPNQRRNILNTVYEAELSFLNGKVKNLNSWSYKKSSRRLQKMAYAIAYFTKNAKKSPNDNSVAISEWESDLAWLKVKYYDGRYDQKWSWNWPKT